MRKVKPQPFLFRVVNSQRMPQEGCAPRRAGTAHHQFWRYGVADVVVSDWQQYIRKAERNERLADELASLPRRYPEWEITTLFYSALHYVNVFLATQEQSANYHRERYDLLDSQTSLGKDYNTLFQWSMNARYDYDEFTMKNG